MSNPWSVADWNVTEQGKIVKRYGEAAALRLANLAGLKRLGETHKKPAAAKVYIIQGKKGPKGDPGDSTTSPLHEFLGFFAPGPFSADESFQLAAAPMAITFPTIQPPDQSVARCGVAPTGSTEFYLVQDVAEFLDDGSTLVCTVTFAAGETTGTFAYGSPIEITLDTALFMVCQTVPDATIRNVQISFCGDPA